MSECTTQGTKVLNEFSDIVNKPNNLKGERVFSDSSNESKISTPNEENRCLQEQLSKSEQERAKLEDENNDLRSRNDILTKDNNSFHQKEKDLNKRIQQLEENQYKHNNEYSQRIYDKHAEERQNMSNKHFQSDAMHTNFAEIAINAVSNNVTLAIKAIDDKLSASLQEIRSRQDVHSTQLETLKSEVQQLRQMILPPITISSPAQNIAQSPQVEELPMTENQSLILKSPTPAVEDNQRDNAEDNFTEQNTDHQEENENYDPTMMEYLK